MTSQRKIAVLGLDALPYHSLKKLAESGVAQYIFNDKTLTQARKIIAIPPMTPASWPSIMSGVNPGKHGIFSFFHIDDTPIDFHYTNLKDLMHPRIHEIMSFNHKKSFILNPIPDYPIMPLKYSKIISNMFFTPKPMSYPPNLHKKYYSHVKFPIEPVESEILDYLDSTISALEDNIMQPPDLVWINLNFPDILFHQDDEFVENPSKYSKIWFKINKIFKLLYSNYDDVFVVSDHGFSIFDKEIIINDILADLNLVKPLSKTEPIPTYIKTSIERDLKRQRVSTHFINPKLVKILKNLKILNLSILIYKRILKKLYRKITRKELILYSGVLPSFIYSEAIYPHGSLFGIYVKNSNIMEFVIKELKKCKGLKIVESAKALFEGPYVNRSLPIIVIPDFKNGYVIGNIELYGEKVRYVKRWNHNLEGIFIHTGKSDLYNWDKIPKNIPNYVAGGLILCSTGLPLSIEQDNKELVERACRYPVSYKNYKTRFLLAKKLYFGKRSKGS